MWGKKEVQWSVFQDKIYESSKIIDKIKEMGTLCLQNKKEYFSRKFLKCQKNCEKG